MIPFDCLDQHFTRHLLVQIQVQLPPHGSRLSRGNRRGRERGLLLSRFQNGRNLLVSCDGRNFGNRSKRGLRFRETDALGLRLGRIDFPLLLDRVRFLVKVENDSVGIAFRAGR